MRAPPTSGITSERHLLQCHAHPEGTRHNPSTAALVKHGRQDGLAVRGAGG